VHFADQHLSRNDDGFLSQRREVQSSPRADGEASTLGFADTQTRPTSAAINSSNMGSSFPLGASVLADGVNFCVFSKQAARVELLLFDDAYAKHPKRVIELDAHTHRTYHYWHVFVPGSGPGQVYAYRAFGPFDLQRGLRFDPAKVLLDPYGRAVVVPDGYSRHMASRFG
jgi:isoamylase